MFPACKPVLRGRARSSYSCTALISSGKSRSKQNLTAEQTVKCCLLRTKGPSSGEWPNMKGC